MIDTMDYRPVTLAEAARELSRQAGLDLGESDFLHLAGDAVGAGYLPRVMTFLAGAFDDRPRYDPREIKRIAAFCASLMGGGEAWR